MAARDDLGDHGRDRAFESEERDRLAGLDDGKLDAGRLEQAAGPRPGRDDHDGLLEIVERLDRMALSDVEAARERGERLVGVDDAGVGLEEHERVGLRGDTEPRLRLLAGEQLAGYATRLEGSLRTDDALAVELEQPVEEEQLLAALRLELAPARERLLRQPHPLLLGIGEPEDPRSPVARAARVPELELLVDDDVVSASSKRPGGREPVQPGADDGDVSHAVRPCSEARRFPRPRARPRPRAGASGRRRARGCSPFRPSPSRARRQGGAACSGRPARRSAPSAKCMSASWPRERSSPFTRATITALEPSNSSGVTTTGPSDVAKSLPFAGPSPTFISRRWRSRADQSFITVNPPIRPSSPMIAATSSS